MHGGEKVTTVTLRFSNVQGSHVCSSSGYRRKSPCELRRDEQRAKSRRMAKYTQPVTEQVNLKASTPNEHATLPTGLSANQLSEGSGILFDNIADNVSTFDENNQQQNDDDDVDNTRDNATFQKSFLDLLYSVEEDITSTLDRCHNDMQLRK